MTVSEAFQHWINHEYTEGMTTREALRSAFETGAQAQKERDIQVAEDVADLSDDDPVWNECSATPDYFEGIFTACGEIVKRIKGE